MKLSPTEMEFYASHIMLSSIGGRGQEKLKKARVLVVGAGGVGSPLILYLAAAGIGQIGIADDDHIEISNLQRQILYRKEHLSQSKTKIATSQGRTINDNITIIPHETRITKSNVADIIKDYDIIADGTDTIETAYCLNEAALAHEKTLIKSSVQGFEGQITTIKAWQEDAPCYHCLFPQDKEQMAPQTSCSQQGVLNMAVCVMAGLLGVEIMKEVLSLGSSLQGRLLLYDALAASLHRISYDKDPHCPICSSL